MRRLLCILLALAVAGLVAQSAVRIMAGRSRPAAAPSTSRAPAAVAKVVPRAPRPRLSANPSVSDLRAAVAGANVVIVVTDATRADHLGCYGYPRDTTPELDRLAKEAVLFEQHFCVYPATTPSTASLLTGLYPDSHRALGVLGKSQMEYRPLDPATLTLERAMKGAGYLTYMYTDNESASPRVGVGEDFDEVYRLRQSGIGVGMSRFDRPQSGLAKRMVRKFRAMLAANGGRRFFAYVHFLPPHYPYDAPNDLKALFLGKKPPTYFETPALLPEAIREYRLRVTPANRAEWVNLYDANLRWADQAVGEVRAALEEAGLLDDTLLILTSDHGEALAEHGYMWHETVPFDETLHIPLLIRFPGGSLGRRVGALTQTVDVMPTILEMLGINAPTGALQGRSLVSLLTGHRTEVRRHAFAQTYGPCYCRVARDKDWVLLQYQDGPSALYHVASDPRQIRNVIASHPDRAGTLRQALGEFLRQQSQHRTVSVTGEGGRRERPLVPARKLSEDTQRELRALGYLK